MPVAENHGGNVTRMTPRPLRTGADRRAAKERRKDDRRLGDMQIPPERVECCPQALEMIQHHVGNALVPIGGLLEKLDQTCDVLTEKEEGLLRVAQAQVRRLQSLRLALSPCGHAAGCPALQQPNGGLRERLAAWLMRG